MAVDNSRKKTTPPRPNLPPEGQPWGRWVTDTLNELKLETGGVKREVISSNKNHNAQLQMSAQQKREIIKAHLMAEEALNIALAASGSTTIYFVAPENPEPGDIWYENVTGIWFRWIDDQWTPITDETLLEALEAILAQRIANDDKIRTFAQDTEPTGMTTEHVGDLWYDTDDKNKLYRWDGLQWVPIRDAGITEAKDAADAAQGTADAAQDAADTAKQTADNAAGAVSQLEAQVTTDLGAMQGRLDTAEGELTTLTGTTLPALDSRLGSAESAVSAAEGRLDTAEGELTDLTTNVLPGLTGELEGVQGELSDHAARMLAAEQAVAAAEAAVTAAEGELATLRDTTLPALDGRLGTAEAAVDAVESAVSSAQSELGTLTGTTLPALDSRLGSAESAVSAAEGRLTVAEAELSTLETDLGTVSGNIGDLIGRVDTVETDVSAAQDAASAASQAASEANQAALNAAGIANGKGKVIYQASAPTGANANANNLWIRTSDNKPHTYNGSIWVAVTDKAATDAAAAASTAQTAAQDADAKAQSALSAAQDADAKAVLAQTSADGKSTVTYGASKKASNAAGKEGDTHYVFSGSNLIATQRRTATAWVDAELGHQIIGSVDLGKATVGQLDGQYIAANTVTADKLLVGSFDNLIADVVSDSHRGTEPHAASTFGTLSTQEDSADADGVSPGRHILVGRTEGDDGIARPVMTWSGADGTNRIRVEPGGRYRFSVLTRLGGTYPNGIGYMRLAVRELTASGSYVTYLSHGGNHSPNWFWREHVVEFTVGSGTRFVALEMQMTAVGANYRLALPQFRQMNAGELIVDGAITGSKIKAGSITAADAVFENGAIQNADIGNLNASKINAGTLDAARIGAGTIDASKISSYNLTSLNATIANGVITNAMIANLDASKINAGTLDAARIGAGSIDASKISSYNLTTANATIGNSVITNAMIANLNASKINAGTLDAARIGANSITAEKLIVGSAGNLLPGYDRLATPEGRAAVPSPYGINPSHPSIWARAGANGYETGRVATLPFVVTAGDRLQFSVDVQASVANTRFYIQVHALDDTSKNRYLFSNQIAPTTFGEFKTEWASDYSGSMVVNIYANHNNGVPNLTGGTPGYQWFKNMRMQKMVGATIIENGAITTDKVAADAITGAKIKAGSITASHGVFATGAIQNADIGNLNASKINAGTLNANRIGADTIEGKHIKGGTITATHGVFATGAIQAADIASINADTITVGTLSGINIQGVNLQGVTISGEYLTLASSAPTVHTLGNLGTQGFDVTTLPTHPIAPSQTLGFFDVVISTSASTPGIPAPYSVFRVGGNRLGSESLPYSPITYFGQWSTYYGKPMGLTTDGAVIQGDTRLEDAEISDAHISALYPSAIYSAQGKTNIDVYDPINIPNNVPLKVNNIQVGSYESRITISGQTRVEGALSATSATITGNATVNGTTTLNGATTIENGNFSGVYGDGSEETGRFFGRQFGGATRSSDQNLSTTSTTTIVLNSTSGYSSRHVSLSGGGLSVARGGYYIVEAAVQFDGSRSSYWRNLIIQVNGSTRRTQPSIASGDSRMASTTAAFELDAGDTVTLATNGSNNSTGMRVHQNVYLTVTRVGA